MSFGSLLLPNGGEKKASSLPLGESHHCWLQDQNQNDHSHQRQDRHYLCFLSGSKYGGRGKAIKTETAPDVKDIFPDSAPAQLTITIYRGKEWKIM